MKESFIFQSDKENKNTTSCLNITRFYLHRFNYAKLNNIKKVEKNYKG